MNRSSTRDIGAVSRIPRFIIVGLSNTAISFLTYLATYALLPAIPGRASASQTLAYGAGICWSYVWNRIWVFESRGRIAAEGARFLIVQTCLMLLSVALIGLAVDRFGASYIWAWMAVMTLITVLNYLALRNWTFRKA